MSKQILLRTSERVSYRGCRQRWQWAYVDGLEPVRSAAALAFGNLIHEALEAWYIPGKKRGQHPAEAFATLFDAQPVEGRQWDENGNAIESRDLGISMLRKYVELYGKEKHIEIIAPEMKVAIDIYNSQGKYLATLVCTFDGAFIDTRTKRVRLFEHKTAKSIEIVLINSQYGDQALTYSWAANIHLRKLGILTKKQTVDGVVFNFLRKAMPDERPRNAAGHYLNKPTKQALTDACASLSLVPAKNTVEGLTEVLTANGADPLQFGEPSLKQPPPWFSRQEMIFGENEFANLEKRIRSEAWEMQQVRKGKLPIYKNPSKECGYCPFRDPCELHEMGGDFQTILDYDYKQRDPYSVYELRKEHK